MSRSSIVVFFFLLGALIYRISVHIFFVFRGVSLHISLGLLKTCVTVPFFCLKFLLINAPIFV